MNNICLIQANIGAMDNVLPFPAQSVPHDYRLFTEQPYPLSELNDRMKARYIKYQHHRLLPHNAFIWLDGRAEIIHEDFVKDITSHLDQYDMVITKHPQRNTIGEEYEFMIDLMSKRNPYLLSRYSPVVIEKERDIIDWSLPLYACGVFAWKRSPRMESFMDEMWRKLIEYSAWDQCWISHLIKQYGLKVYPYNYEMVKIGKHL